MYKYILLLLFLATVFLLSCEDIFVSDLEDKEMILLAPADQLSTDLTNHTFWWGTIEGAETYQLQIASPSFTTMEQLVADTALSADKYELALTPGIYEWRVRAVNSGSETEYTSRSFTIENSADISRQRVLLSYPTDNFVTNEGSLNLRWEKLFNADSYVLEWKYQNRDYAKEPITVETTYTEIALDEENTFIWSIKGYNKSTGTYSGVSERTILVDKTAPVQAQLSYPTNTQDINITDDKQLTLRWTRDEQSGASEFDSVYIYKENQSSVLLLKAKSSTFTYLWEDIETGSYSYKVKSYDAAGNEGPESDIFSFSIVE